MAYDFNSLTKQAPEATNRDKFYTDFEDVDPNKFHQISELTEWLRTKAKGSDVREVIAQLFERTWLEESKEGNANMEVAQARGRFPVLNDRLDNADRERLENARRLAQKANESDLAVERERIDKFTTLAEGSTTGDAELIDARVGADGVTYANVGGAIRGQISNVHTDFVNLQNLEFTGLIYEQGNLPNGVPNYTDKNIRTKDYIPEYITKVVVKENSNLMFACVLYNDNNKFLKFYTGSGIRPGQAFPEYWFLSVNLNDVYNNNPNCKIKVVVQHQKTGTQITLNERKNILMSTTLIDKINKIDTLSINKLKGKRLSVLGDSISTYSGVVPTGYASQYPNGDVTSFDKTWVGKLLNKTEMQLDTLNAWAGSRVTDTGPLPSTSRFVNSARWSNLGNPDVIIVYGGTNDLFQTNPPQVGSIPDYTAVPVDDFDLTKVASAYLYLLMKLKETYPNAKVYCCGVTDFTRDISSPYWKNANGLSKQQLADIIKECCDVTGATFIDLLKCGISYYTYSTYAYDGDLHPNALGMEYIASYIYSKL